MTSIRIRQASASQSNPVFRSQRQLLSSLKPELEEATRKELERLEQVIGKKEALIKVEETAIGAATGRIDQVALGSEACINGICIPEQMEARLVDNGEPGCVHDLLDVIAAETLRQEGRVVSFPLKRIPCKPPVAAATRF